MPRKTKKNLTLDNAIRVLEDRVTLDREIRDTATTQCGQGSQDYEDFCETECQAIETVLKAVKTPESIIVSRQIIEIKPQKVCCKSMIVKIGKTENGEYILEHLQSYGGCKGNLLAISKLIQNKPLTEIITILKGNQCGDKGTSCTDQLAIGLEAFLNRTASLAESSGDSIENK